MSILKRLFYELIDKYSTELDDARTTQNYKRPFGSLVRKDITDFLKQYVNNETYLVKGSVGAGIWTDVPWIAVFDKRITQSAQKGVYLVYLLNKDSKTLYLTLNQGATVVAQDGGSENGKLTFTGIASADNAKTTDALKERAEKIRSFVKLPSGAQCDSINTNSKAYDAGCIFYKAYTLDSLPDDEILIADLQSFIDAYRLYYEHQSVPTMPCASDIPVRGNNPMIKNKKDIIHQIKDYIESKGFSYSDNLIENFFLSLKSKPFVILAGTSGTGKTRLVKLFAEAIGAEFRLVSVRPDWSDGSDLFGHKDLNGRFIAGPVCECFDLAKANPNKPVFLCLDEMNLARVEYYLSDFLSVIESREMSADGKISTEPIAQYRDGIPDNLYVVGTVNMDETTFPFSKKVLDRANTIEFSFVSLIPDFEPVTDSSIEKADIDNDFLRTKYLVLTKDCADEKDYVTGICEKLEALNKILLTANAHVGYRVRDEIVFYMLNNKNAGYLLADNEALDYEIMQKILPRIQGSSAAIKNMLIELFQYCCNNVSGIDPDSKDVGIQMKQQASSAVYPISAAKIGYMMTRYEEDGFTSYWL